MPASPEVLFRRFDALGIRHTTYHHPAVFTVAQATALRGDPEYLRELAHIMSELIEQQREQAAAQGQRGAP